MSTVSDTVDILEAFLADAVPGLTVTPRSQPKIAASDLPTVIILPQGGTPERESARNYRTPRDYIIAVLLEKLSDDKAQQTQEARERGWDYLDTIPGHFAAHSMLDDDTKGIIVHCTLPRENGVQLTSWGGDPFTGIEFRVTIVTSKEVS